MDLVALEQQRQALETNLQNLRRSLRHWHMREAEYEGLKEEIRARDGLSPSDLEGIATTYGGDLVDEKEVRDLTGLERKEARSSEQILGLIERRQEYVQRNVETLQRQFFDAEAKQEELAFAAASAGHADEDGGLLPLTEIHEELDDQDNVISSTLSRPEEDTAKAIELLRKAGLDGNAAFDSDVPTKEEGLKPAITNIAALAATTAEKRNGNDCPSPPATSDSGHDSTGRRVNRQKSVSFSADTKPSTEPTRVESEDGRKSVSFAEKVAVMPAAPPPDPRSVSFSPEVEEIPAPPLDDAMSPDLGPLGKLPEKRVPLQADPGRQKELRESYKPGDKVIQLNGDDEIESVQVVMPNDESAEDAQTRREMLEYSLNEVGDVVAQIDLDEADGTSYIDAEEDEYDDAASYFTSSEYPDDDEDTPYTTGLSDFEDDDDEDEDEYGRTKRRMVSDKYKKDMLEMERRLIANLGPNPAAKDIADADPELDPNDLRRLVIREKRSSMSSSASDDGPEKKPPTGKKRVSFASPLDVAAEPGSPPLKAMKQREGENVAPVVDRIPGRDAVLPASEGPTSGNASRSKVNPFTGTGPGIATDNVTTRSNVTRGPAFNDDVDDAATGRAGTVLADKLVERTTSSRKPAVAPSGEDLDSIADRRQLATEYFRRRNDIIKQQGGFQARADEEDEAGELFEEKDGKVRKISRFRAARIKGPD